MKTRTAREAVDLIRDGATLMIGGFMGVGSPERAIDELVRQGRRKLTVIAAATQASLDVSRRLRTMAIV